MTSANSHHGDIVALDRRHVWHPYTQEQVAPEPIPIVSGQGALLYDSAGRSYLDLISSWWVTTHGHAHPVVAAAIARQAQQLEQVIFAGMTHEPAVQLATRLTSRLPAGLTRVFYSDDGSTAVEVALKMACQYWINRGEPRNRFLAFEGGYHGDTVGAMSAGRSSGFFDAFQSMMFQVDTLPFPETWIDDETVEQKEQQSMAALNRYLTEQGKNCAAVIVEPLVQGAAGMRMCRPEFLRCLAATLKAHNVLLIFDEVMTGFGRTGALFACHKAGVTPDIICLSKGLTSGFLPLSVTICQESIYAAFLASGFDHALAHGHSFTANPIGCAAALASLELFDRDNCMARLVMIERLHRERLADLARHDKAHRWRVMGTIAALDIRTDTTGYHSEVGPRLKRFFLERGLLIRPLGNVIYLLPPYCITESELHRGWNGIEEALNRITANAN
ncbi:MAG: adenosylmethionine--8-amino-7-oxononanoate transaminase [Magnetococcales bacterium]|nr:adenosylmethionine--8-amino-7-oxononanoate transaminase [Magnetococcales bacterium]